MPSAWIWFSLLSYLLGSVPFGKIIGLLVSGIDVSRKGSGNIGATNVGRVVGPSWGVLTLILDMSKGVLPIALFLRYGGSEEGSWPLMLIALAPVIGHQFSVFTALKGGKGVATTIGVWLALSPVSVLLALTAFMTTAVLCRYISLASLVFAFALPIILFISEKGPYLLTASLLTALLILFRHKDNIERICKGIEPRWGEGHHDRR